MYSITRLKLNKNDLKINITGGNVSAIFSVVLRYRGKLTADIVEYEFEITERNKDLLKLKLELNNIEFKIIYWDVIVKTDQEEYFVGVGKLRNLIRFPLYDGKYIKKNSNMFMHPYITEDRTLAFQYRDRTDADKLSFRIQEMFLLFIYLVTRFFWNRKKIVLVYEKFCTMAQDNGYYFFKYCMENDIEAKLGVHIYYVIDRDSPDVEKLSKYKDNIVYFMSFTHKMYMLAAKVFIGTDTKKHLYAWRMRMSILGHIFRKKPLIFLQHGVLALKRVEGIYGKGRIGDCSVFIVSSDDEKKIVAKEFGYSDDEIAITGLARWDVLEDKSKDKNEILMMPTWRNWLEDITLEEFKNSDYYINYTNVLKSNKLANILESKNLILNFYIHPKFRDYIQGFDMQSNRIRIIPFGSEQLNELIMRCKMLITDYSSVSWDIFYQDKPTIFYQFDLKQYNEASGSYIDMETQIFGDRVETYDGMLELLEQYADDDFAMKQKYSMLRQEYLKYIDHDNSKRICEYIRKFI